MSDDRLNWLHLLENIRFTKIREREYAGIIRQSAPGLEAEYANLLRSWEPVLGQTEYNATQWAGALLYSPEAAGISPAQAQAGISQLAQEARQQSEAFIGQLTAMRAYHPAVQASPAASELIRYISGASQPGQTPGFAAYSGNGQPAPGSTSFRHDTGSPAAQQEEQQLAHIHAPVAHPQPEAAPSTAPVPIGKHTLPPLPYAYNALEPHIDEKTMRIHHDKHHQSYVDGLNNAENKLAEARRSGDFSLVKHWERELAFNGAGHYLHTLFWNIMAPNAGGPPTGLAAEQIRADFGSFDAFKKQFSEAADKVEGGGWAIWVWSPRSQRTEILTAEKHQNLSQWDVVPLLALDVWEHAYYLKHQNKRPDYIKDWWNVVNWKHVNERLAAARQLKWQPY
ncbi:superoxide dismutase [Paenibacillus sp. YN15]|uniref:superoxide dismutase n=1 Tax=Paenibacillus sp. YN15 TaxID=1742774 RepID=UPI000DCF4A3A|nr:superoxide dismutase [Paenibacillus sp. YN15]RAU93716.1 superoxide dismutase [Paenibacillus sp. YN15]